MDLNIRTGDAILFSGNTPTGFLLRTFISSQWNHSGIGVRFIKVPDDTAPDGYRHEISLTDEGELYILETNTGSRWDDISQQQLIGAGFSKAEWAFQAYNRIAVRRLRNIFRTPQLAQLTIDFAQRNLGNRFPSSSTPFLSVWLGVPLADKDPNTTEMFCSELMAHYYEYCIGGQFEKVMGTPYDGTLSKLFGTGAPSSQDMYNPGHYAYELTPNAPIFAGPEEDTHTQHADLLYVILQPLLIIAVVALIIWMLLPHD